MRKNGYYWIKINDKINKEDPISQIEDGWEVAYFDEDGWYSIWDGGTFSDDQLIEIDECRIERNLNNINNQICPQCKGNNIELKEIRNDNGVLGDGYCSWVIDSWYVCKDCNERIFFKK